MGKVAAGTLLMARGFAKLAIAGTIKGLTVLKSVLFGAVGVIRQAVNQLGRFAAIAGGIAAVAIAKVAQGAVVLGEQTDRARIVFGDFADKVIAQAKLMAEGFGVSKTEFVQAASAFGTIFEGVGYIKKDAADLSMHFVKLATDLTSLVHIPVAEAMEKIQSGLAGQVRPLREVGVFMSEETIKAQALKMGLHALGGELSEQQKIQARVAFITEHLKIATGNLAATAGSAGNEVRGLSGRFSNLADTVGTALLGFIGPAVDELQVGIQALSIAWDRSSMAALSASTGVLGGVQEQTQGIGYLQMAIGKIADVWQTVGLGFAWLQTRVTDGLIWMVENLNGFAQGIGQIVSYFTGVKVAAADFTATWLEDLKRMRAEQEKTFTAKLVAPLASDEINRAFEESRKKIEAARKELGQARRQRHQAQAGRRGQGTRGAEVRQCGGGRLERSRQRDPPGPVRDRGCGGQGARGHGPEHQGCLGRAQEPQQRTAAVDGQPRRGDGTGRDRGQFLAGPWAVVRGPLSCTAGPWPGHPRSEPRTTDHGLRTKAGERGIDAGGHAVAVAAGLLHIPQQDGFGLAVAELDDHVVGRPAAEPPGDAHRADPGRVDPLAVVQSDQHRVDPVSIRHRDQHGRSPRI